MNQAQWSATCLTERDLKLLALGQLDDVGLDAAQTHLEHCPSCLDRLRVAPARDDLVGALRAAPTSLQRLEALRQPIHDLIGKLEELAPDSDRHRPQIGPRSSERLLRARRRLNHVPTSVAELAARIIAAGVMTPQALVEFQESMDANANPADGAALAERLLAAGKLTSFQVDELLSGGDTPLVLGDYQLLQCIGAGGMGQVFKAHHRHMERVVAIKLLPTELTEDADAIRRFQQEVRAAARLVHPHIVQAYDASVQKGVWYLVMEYVEGQDLSGVVADQGPLPTSRAIDYVRQAAQGLAYAHRNGVVHRDVKPANLLLDKTGSIKILDMGIARVAEQTGRATSDGLTQSGQVVGTVDYMAPEQALNRRGADARADIYSLGCTLWNLLTGSNLFDGETLTEKLLAHQNAPRPSLATFRLDAPPRLADFLARMVARNPDERPSTMEEVEAALGQLAAAAANPTSGAAQREPPAAQASPTPVAPRAANGPEMSHARPVRQESRATESSLVAASETTSLTSNATGIVQTPATDPRRSRRHDLWPLAVGGGLAGIVLLAFGIWVVVRDRHGNEVGRMKVPDGGAVIIEDHRPKHEQSTSPTLPQPIRSPLAKPVGPQPPLAVVPFNETEARRHQQAWAKHLGLPVEKEVTLPGGEKLTMVLIPPGEFIRVDQKNRIPYERHFRVRITSPYYLSKYEVTQAQWQAVMGWNPSSFRSPHPENPVENMTWYDTQDFLEKLNASDADRSLEFRLPTEAQWEHACRAGTTTDFSFGDDAADAARYGWTHLNNDSLPHHPVGQLMPNAFGLYDLYGNVAEYCADWFADDYYALAPLNDPLGPPEGSRRVVRGGASGSFAVKSSISTSSDPKRGIQWLGFRIAADAVDWRPITKTTQSTPMPQSPHTIESVGPPPSLAKEPFDASEAKRHQLAWATYLKLPFEKQVVIPNGQKLVMVLIPPGEFTRVHEFLSDKKPCRVRITNPFYLGKYEVTQAQWQAVMGRNPSEFCQNVLHPLESVSWEDIQPFLEKLNRHDAEPSMKFLLPTEAQWEYACRAGTSTAYSFGDDEADLSQYGWFKGSISGETQTQPVGLLKPNAFGLHDLLGNVSEWCDDWHEFAYFRAAPLEDPPGPAVNTNSHNKVIKGGSYRSESQWCQSSSRHGSPSVTRDDNLGFRLCATLSWTASPSGKMAQPAP